MIGVFLGEAHSAQSSLAEHADILEKIAIYYLCGTITIIAGAIIQIFIMLFALKTEVAVIKQKCKDEHDKED